MFPIIAVGVLGKCAGVSCGFGMSATKAAAIASTPLAVAASTTKRSSDWNNTEKIRILKELFDKGVISLESYNILLK